MACCFGGDEPPPQFISSTAQPQVEELRGQLSAIIPPLEVDWGREATVNLSSLPSAQLPGRPHTPLGTFERRQSMRPVQRPATSSAEEAPAVEGRRPSSALQWTDSRKLLEAAIAMEQMQPIPEGAAAAAPASAFQGAGWGGGDGWDDGGLVAAEHRLQTRLFKLKLEHIVMEGDGNCQFRAVSYGLYGTQRYHAHVRKKAVAFMQAQRGDFEAFLGEEFGPYIRQMSRSGTWGDELTLRAACEALGVVVNVVTSDASNWFLRYIPRSIRPAAEIFLTYIAPLHYNAIRRQNTGDRLRQSFGRQHSQLTRAVSTYRKRYGIPENPRHIVQAAMAT